MTTAQTHQPASAIGLRLSIMMFIEFFIWGAWYITVGNYMAAHNMSDGIGWAYTVGPIAAIISPFFLGMIADRFFSTEKVLGVLHLLGGIALLAAPMFAVGNPKSPWPFIGMLLLHMLCYMPTLGLTNSISFANMTNSEKQFPLIRVLGTIGWIVAGLVIGFTAKLLVPASVDRSDPKAMDAAVTAMSHFLYIGGAAGILLGIYSFTLPHTPPPAAGKPISVRDVLGLDSLELMKSPSFAIFILCSFLICIPLAAYYAYAPVFAKDIGIAPDQVPVQMSFGQMSEIFFMLIMPLMFSRLGVKWMLAAGMLAWVVRYGLFAGASHTHASWMVLGGIILHGICYDFFFVTGFIYVDKKAPAAIRGQAQGFLVLVTQGLGLGVGAQAMSGVVKAFTNSSATTNWFAVWLIPCVAAAVILAIFVTMFRDDSASTPVPAEPVPAA